MRSEVTHTRTRAAPAMPMVDQTSQPRAPVLVTGANGYIASWLVKRLLERDFDVHATVRDPRDPRKTGHLEAIAHACPGTLSLFQADLLDPRGFDRAMAGCQLVFHTASPLIVRNVEDPQRDLVEPATLGTRNVLDAANRTPSVRRIVRDVAEGHIRAGLLPNARGRHILVSESLSLIEMAGILRSHFGDAFPFPRQAVSNAAARMLAPSRGIPQAVAKRNLGYPLRFDSRRARDRLGLNFRPAAESIVDHFRRLLDDGLLPPTARRP